MEQFAFFKDFYWAYLSKKYTNLEEFLLLNSHLNRYAKFQKILRGVYKKNPSDKLEKLFYAGPYPMAFTVVDRLEPMPVQGHLRAPFSHMCEKFGIACEWNLIFQNSKPVTIKMVEIDKWDIHGEDESAIDAVLEVIKF